MNDFDTKLAGDLLAKLDRQRLDLARCYAEIARLRHDKARLLADLKEAREDAE